MTKAEVKLVRSLFKTEISDDEAAEIFDQIQEFIKEIRQEFRQMYDPEERP